MNSFVHSFLSTPHSSVLLVLRVVLGLVLFPHGAQKLLGWFGGYGFTATMQYFTQVVNLPWFIGLLVILLEFFGALFLILGFATRLTALGVIALMIGAAVLVCLPNGFFMNWTGSQKGEGIEYHLLVIGMALPLVWQGAGALSIDSLLSR